MIDKDKLPVEDIIEEPKKEEEGGDMFSDEAGNY